MNEPQREVVRVGKLECGPGRPLFWILGPCVIESHDLTMQIAETLAGLADRLQLPLVFKASFDKANRTSGKSFRGPGLRDGLRTLAAGICTLCVASKITGQPRSCIHGMLRMSLTSWP